MTPDQKLAKIVAILGIGVEGNAPDSHHAFYNLEGAIIDIDRTGECDAVCLRTLKRVRDQLADVAQVLSS